MQIQVFQKDTNQILGRRRQEHDAPVPPPLDSWDGVGEYMLELFQNTFKFLNYDDDTFYLDAGHKQCADWGGVETCTKLLRLRPPQFLVVRIYENVHHTS